MITRATKNSHQLVQFSLNVNLMLIYITTTLVFPLRLPLALNRTTLVILKDIV